MFRTGIAAAVLSVFFVLAPGNAGAQPAGSPNDAMEPAGSAGKIDWSTGMITATGIGAPPSQPVNSAQARAMSERAAQTAAYRNLVEAVRGVRVDSSNTVEHFIVSSDVIKTQVNGVIQGATIMEKKYLTDGSIEITVGMMLKGALSELLLPRTARTAPGPAVADGGREYTGLIVDARGLGFRPALAPRIMTEDGKEIYGPASVNREAAVREGMAGYLKDASSAQTDPRVADKPLLIKAVKLSGRADVVISNADAAAFQSTSLNLSMLEQCRVIILVD